MKRFKERTHSLKPMLPIQRIRAGLMACLLLLTTLFGALMPETQTHAAEPTITGTCHIDVDDLGANTGGSAPYTTFFVTMPDGQTYHGECIDHGSYIPLAGDYSFTGTWNGSSYDIVVESRYFAETRWDVYPEERPNFDLYGQGYTQRVGNFTYMPYGYVQVLKQSANGSITEGNALYSLMGAEFTVYDEQQNVLGTLITGEDGSTNTLELPAGQTVTICETKAPEGYFAAESQTATISPQETTTLTFVDIPAYEPAGLLIGKFDGERTYDTSENLPQGAASLAGAEFTAEYYDTLDYDSYAALKEDGIAPARTWVISTDEKGFASFDDAHLVSGDALYQDADGQAVLPRGTLVVYETKPSEGYLLNEDFLSFQKIQEEPAVSTVTYSMPEVPEQVIRGGIEVSKRDLESDLAIPLGGASLDGTEFEIRTNNERPVIVNGTSYEKDEVVATLTIENGYAATGTDTLPYGAYTLQEIRAGEGYNLTDGTAYEFSIRENGILVNPVTGDGHVHNQVKRSDFEFSKKAGDSADVLAGVPFRVTSRTTGESHIIVTDENGYFNSASSWNPHTRNTNGNDWALDTADSVIDSTKLDTSAGLWFGLTANGTMAETDDTLGALPYDTYDIEELRCTTNEGYQLITTAVTITRDAVTYDFGTLDDVPQTNAHISTHAYDPVDGDSNLMVGNVKVADKVTYSGLMEGEDYRLITTVVDAETGEAITMDGQTIAATHDFTAQEASGYEIVEMTLSTTELGGSTITIFEELYRISDGILIAEHRDRSDVDQQLRVVSPEISTTAADGLDGDKTVIAEAETVIIDTVSYRNLIPGQEYTLIGTLHIKGVNVEGNTTEDTLLDAQGKPITADVTFTPDAANGSVDVTFTFDATGLTTGTELVVFESLFDENGIETGVTIAVHEDINDEAQTVTVETPASDTPAPDQLLGTTYGKTGASAAPVMAAVVLLLAAAGAGTFYGIRLHRARREEEEEKTDIKRS